MMTDEKENFTVSKKPQNPIKTFFLMEKEKDINIYCV
jgi:hypothetical protein